MLLGVHVNLLLHLLEVVGYENASTLTAGLWLGDEEDNRRLFGLRLGHLAGLELLLAPLHALRVVLADLVQVLRKQPSLGDEVVDSSEKLITMRRS